MTRDEILAYQERMNKLRATTIGAAFFKFKNATERFWIADTEDSFTDKNRASTKRYDEERIAAEKAIIAEIEALLTKVQ